METGKKDKAVLSPQIFIGLIMALFLFGCASSGIERVPAQSAGVIHEVDVGTVVAVKPVQIDGETTYLGPSTGAIIGSAIGQTSGNGSGQILAAAGGAAVGGIVGGMIEKKLSAKQAQEVTVAVDDGETVVVIQELQDPAFIEGDRVNVMHTRTGEARLSHSHYDIEQDY